MCLNRMPLEKLTMESQIYVAQLHTSRDRYEVNKAGQKYEVLVDL